MFCVECGKEGPIFKDGVCAKCYVKSHTFTSGPDIIDLPVCSHCNSFKYKNRWTSDILNDVLRRYIKKTFKISKEIKNIDINPVCKETKQCLQCNVFISGFIDHIEIAEKHDLTVRFKKTVCDVCSKRFGGYHEAIVQVRASGRNLNEKELRNIRLSVENIVDTLQSKGNRSLFITDLKKEHGGLDFFISDKGAALTITKHIQEQYGGQIKKSSKNIGMKDSRQIYRMTYLIRLPGFRIGDFIFLNDSYFYISTIHGNKVHTIQLSNWSEQVFDAKDLQKASILGGKKLIKEMILVSQSQDEIQVMDTKTYKTFELKKPKTLSFDSNTVQIVNLEEKLFLFPRKNTINK